MKRLILIVLVLTLAANLGMAQSKYVAGFDATVLVGKVKVAEGGIKSVIGLSPVIGIGYKSYFSPLKQDSHSVYWNIGTDLLVAPFLGIGVDYKFMAGDLPLYAGLNISSRLLTLGIPFPSVSVGLFF